MDRLLTYGSGVKILECVHYDVFVIKIFSCVAPRGKKFCFDKKYFEVHIRLDCYTWCRHYSSLGVKTDVTGLMIIAFQSRECGFIMPLTEEQVKEINQYCEGKMHVDEEAAMATGEIKKTTCY